jgi:hypothetical protein
VPRAVGILTGQLVGSRWRFSIAVAVVSTVALISCSRIVLQAHSIDEILIGVLIGGCGDVAVRRSIRTITAEQATPGIALLLGGTLALIVALQGVYLDFEPAAEEIALSARGALRFRPGAN